MTTTLDLEKLKADQRRMWAGGDYAAVGARIHPMAESLVAAADLAAGARVLDVATGSGNAAIAAARCGCAVTGVDYVPELLARARARAAAEGFEIDFTEGDAERLPYPDGAFDAVLSCVGVMFTPDQERAAAELLRVCRPGGTVALDAWTPDGFIGRLLTLLPRPPGQPSPLAWGTAHRVCELLGPGAVELHLTERTHVFRHRSAEDFVEFMRANYGPMIRAFERTDPAERGRLHAELVSLCERSSTGPGMRVPAAYLEVVLRTRG